MSSTHALLFQHMNVIMLTLDCAGMFTSLNPAAERCFACAAVELLGRPFTVVLDPFSAEKANLMIALDWIPLFANSSYLDCLPAIRH